VQGIFFGPANERQLGFADTRSPNDLREFFTDAPHPYGSPIPAVEDINYFLNLTKGGANEPVAPDND
jgi:hypothetical protein